MTTADTTQHTTEVLDTDTLHASAAHPAAPAYAAPTPTSLQAASQPDNSAFAITSFVLGLASVVSSWVFIPPIVGLVFGILALRRGTKERTLAIWGVALNAVMLGLTLLVVLGFVAIAGFGILGGLASGSW